jgi:hypothetical protein
VISSFPLSLNWFNQPRIALPTGGSLPYVGRKFFCSVTMDLLSANQMTHKLTECATSARTTAESVLRLHIKYVHAEENFTNWWTSYRNFHLYNSLLVKLLHHETRSIIFDYPAHAARMCLCYSTDKMYSNSVCISCYTYRPFQKLKLSSSFPHFPCTRQLLI